MKNIFLKIKKFLKGTDVILLGTCIACSCFGLLVLYSMGVVFFESNSIFYVQALATVLGIIVAITISLIDYKTILQFWKIIAPIAIILVLLTFFIGLKAAGADDKAWLALPGGLTFQPSELLKIAFIITFAIHLNKVKESINQIGTLLLLLVHGAVPVLLIHFQGDDGTAIVFACIMIFMLFAAGLSLKYILIGLLASPFVAAIMWFFI
ncbi:MAG: FtsW/RodA/SpoVE family cell cycle protein, partial [Oscillospiraceae bacterium]